MPTWLLAWLRHLRTERAPSIAFALVVFVTAFAAAVLPRVVDAISDDALRQTVAAAAIAEANLQLLEDGRIPPGADDPLATVATSGIDREQLMANGIRALIADRKHLVETPRWSVLSTTRVPGTIRLRLQPGALDRTTLVEGRLPTAVVGEAEIRSPHETESTTVSTFEGVVSTESLAALEVEVGDTLLLEPDRRDGLFFGADPDRRIGLSIVGAFEPSRPEDPFWFGDPSLWQPTLRALSSDIQFLDVNAGAAIELYPGLMDESAVAGWSFRYTWRYYLDPGRLDADTNASLIADFRILEGTYRPRTSFLRPAGGTIVRGDLGRILERHENAWQSAAGVLTVASIGPATVASIALLLMAGLVTAIRRAALALTHSRGASIGQMLLATAAEGALIVGLPVAVATGVAVALRPSGSISPSLAAGGVVGLVAVLALVAGVLRAAITRPGGATRTRGADRPSPRRLAAEGLVVMLAIIGAYLLRQRGVTGASSAGTLVGADPYIAAVPALAGIAAGLVAVRVIPIPTALLAHLAARRRDLVPVLAIRRASRERDTAPVMIVLLTATTVGAFSLAVVSHLTRASEAVSWHEVGAPFRLSAGTATLPSRLDATVVPGVTGVAAATRMEATTSATATRFDVLAVDMDAYRSLIRGTPGEVPIPLELTGTGAQPYPAIVSQALAAVRDGPDLGETFRLTIDGVTGEYRAIELRDSFPTLPVDGRFVVVDRDDVQAIDPNARLRTSSLFIAADPGAREPLADTLQSAAPASRLVGQAERSASISREPIVAAVVLGTIMAAGTAAVYAALSVGLSLALTGSARAAETAHLRTLGLRRAQAIWLLIAEHGPATLIAFVAGAALGFGIFQLVGTAIGLSAVIGSTLDIPSAIGPAHLLGLLAAVVAVVGLGIALAAAIERRTSAAAAIRRGIE